MLVKRDPAVESIIESRKHTIIENPYTRLAQITSQAPRLSQRAATMEMPAITESDIEMKDRTGSSRSARKASPMVTTELDSQEWDDGLAIEYDKGNLEFIQK